MKLIGLKKNNVAKIVTAIMAMLPFGYAMAQDACRGIACPNGRTAIDICFIKSDVYSTPRWKLNAQAACGEQSEKFIIKRPRELVEVFEKLNKDCRSIRSAVFFSHGKIGEQEVGNLRAHTLSGIAPYACLFQQGSEIMMSGCNVGRGCRGDLLVFSMAKTLLHKGGSVTAPTFYTATMAPGIVPHFSMNGVNRQVLYSPDKNPPEQWAFTGAFADFGQDDIDVSHRCSDEMTAAIQAMSSAKAAAQSRGCSSPNELIRHDEIEQFRRLSEKIMKDRRAVLDNDETRVAVSSALHRMQFQIEVYGICQPDSHDDENNQTNPRGRTK